MKKLVIAALFVMGAVAVATTTAKANVLGEQSQSQKLQQSGKAECKSSYGQNLECNVELNQNAEQSQSQKILGEQIVIKDGRRNKVHVPADTAMDTQTLITAMGMTVMGGLAYVARKKIS